MKKIAIIVPGTLPLPPVKGGAVEGLVESLRKYNEGSTNIKLVLFSIFDQLAEKKSKNSYNTEYIYIHIPGLFKLMDKVLYFIVNKLLKKDNATSYRFLFQRLVYIYFVALNLKNNDYDRVVLENHGSLLFTLKLFKNYKRYSDKYYYHVHNETKAFYGCENILKKSVSIIGVSNWVLSTLPPDVKDNAHLTVLPNRVDEKKFNVKLTPQKEARLREKYKLGSKKIVMFTGMLNPGKGILELMLAWKKMNRKDAILLIVGGAYYKSDVHSEFEEKLVNLSESMKDKIRFTGFVDYKEMPYMYALADLVVLPSVGPEAACLTVIEAITANKTVITTDSGGIPEYAKGKAIIINHKKDVVNNLVLNISKYLSNPRGMNTELTESHWKIEDFYNTFLKIMNK